MNNDETIIKPANPVDFGIPEKYAQAATYYADYREIDRLEGRMPAESLKPSDYETDANKGELTKREHFAAMAMQGMAACDSYRDASWNQIAEAATIAADALLKELDK